MTNDRGRPTRLTVEKLAVDCLDVRDLRRIGALKGPWITFTGLELRCPKSRKCAQQSS